MRTQEMLEQLPNKQREYLLTLKDNIAKAKAENQIRYIEEHRSCARGYIKALVDCGVVKDFKTVWCWFTL